MPRFLLSFIVLSFLSFPAFAQDSDSLVKDGQTILHISATERTEVQQDLLMATLRYEAENKDAKKLQNDINSTMKKALDKAKAVKEVKTSTGQYYVHRYVPPHNRKEPPRPDDYKWRGNQSLQLESTSADALLALAGDLQDMGLMMNGLSYTISPDRMEDVKDSLMEAALRKLKTRAERAAKALGRTQTELIEVNIDSGGFHPRPMPMMRNMAMSAQAESMAAPVAAPSDTDITLTVNAKALLKP